MSAPPKDTWSASQYNKSASFVYSDAYTQPILDLLQLKPGERVLDIGCGTGELSVRLQEFLGQEGVLVGVDASEDMNLVIPEEFKHLSVTFDGVRSAMHQALKKRGLDPIKLDPWYFPRPEQYTKVLEAEEFQVRHISLHPRITPLPGHLNDWLLTFARTSA
ncbi:hypothetical protein FRC07_012249, partial [Ceratobasidium sp. 392]